MQELQYDKIAGAVGVSAPTVKSWVSILERSGVIYILHSYASDISWKLIVVVAKVFSQGKFVTQKRKRSKQAGKRSKHN